ncbi:hypothetical protein BUZ61_01410 [Staphylococcus nepalensis]|uniref:Uncharacterized protein n=1 Tax=Staphylococcus nepalensis TaxID=214473 RepID=A0A291JL65_9STAP|nr:MULTISPECIES: hypothetical protein [Staphylococcus]ATH60136.1 hypothetical protein BJD96_07375 [Staphylococcus nepalensis]ATH65226.1 hypothetical protein BJG89_07705 [Staphylococcus nepalensis]AWI44594.1 hypothetical protein BJG88_07500 [Staphylococcus nepalensis]MCY1038588.1 hypothetical protein [Staphylococcus nepalensis]NWN84708.1 hypothetical protein [Staphylococcus sp.]
MTIFDLPNFLWISVVAVVVVTLFCTLVLNKWFSAAILTFIVLAIAAFLIPNFENITYEPLLGFAAFMAVLSLIMSFLIWYFTRDFRRKRREKKAIKEMRKRGITPENDTEEYKSR